MQANKLIKVNFEDRKFVILFNYLSLNFKTSSLNIIELFEEFGYIIE